jgi:hypothetical protein
MLTFNSSYHHIPQDLQLNYQLPSRERENSEDLEDSQLISGIPDYLKSLAKTHVLSSCALLDAHSPPRNKTIKPFRHPVK